MAKLYPPYIEGTIPAFTGGEIIVPFSMNRAVSKNQIAGFSLKIKTVQNNYFIATVNSSSFSLDTMEAVFTLDESITKQLTVGQFYKLQMAYKDTDRNEEGYYSTVGVIKYSAKPEIFIEGLEYPGVNVYDHGYIGVYNQGERILEENIEKEKEQGPFPKDITEKVYTSRFKIYDSKNAIVYDTGDVIHNSTEDVYNYKSTDYCEITDDLEKGVSYYIEYSVVTMNGLKCATPKYRVVQRESIPPELSGKLSAEANFEEGFIDVTLTVDRDAEGIEQPVVGAFLLSRANIQTPNKWENLRRLSFQSELASGLIFRDCTIAQGETYVYSLQQYNDLGLYSNRMLSNEIYSDFEDAFLYDGARQLKIKYNPKISSFKNTILETKQDTIGSKHPFIFRNGKVKYKDFPIAGLISYFMDEAKMFMNEEDYRLEEKTTNLVSSNQTSERLFKLEVLDWLGNGEPKLFRSPGEGNYLVRLMNVSMTPVDTLGRMLHNFTCNAYEIADCTYENLMSLGVMRVDELQGMRLRWATVPLFQKQGENDYQYFQGEVLENANGVRVTAQSVFFTDMLPGDWFYLNAPNPDKMSESDLEPYKISIGATGSYNIDLKQPITSIYIPAGIRGYTGSVTFSYYGDYTNNFSLIKSVDMKDVPAYQVIGEQWATKEYIDSYSGEKKYKVVNDNVLTALEDVKTNIYKIFAMRFEKRPVETLYVKSFNDFGEINYLEPAASGRPILDPNQVSSLYFDRACTEANRADIGQDLNPLYIYEIRSAQYDYTKPDHNDITHNPAPEEFHRGEYYYIDRNPDLFYPTVGSYLDGGNHELIPSDQYSTTFYYNLGIDWFEKDTDPGKFYGIDLGISEYYDVENLEDFHDIILMNGVMLTMTYQEQILNYLLEETDPETAAIRQEYDAAVVELELAKKALDESSSEDEINSKIEAIDVARQNAEYLYNKLIEALEKAIIEYKEAHAIPYEESFVR